ncbi:sugar transferase [Phaeocystidibacter luteus]|uniref:Sugar transferase n=1 Tax=Phaeocystidibacter luteus TaxID=911197 RepID=A0A6N6RMN9_9FLAO|nr:sugar transferase [Phaeocystidibacter luteus]KAB2814844.1 sugar transferase [Phaeocystidibacter luteus]
MNLAYIGADESLVAHLKAAEGHQSSVFSTLGEFIDSSASSNLDILYLDALSDGKHWTDVLPVVRGVLSSSTSIVLLGKEGFKPNPMLLKQGVDDAYVRPFDSEILTERAEFIVKLKSWKSDKESDVDLVGRPISRSKRLFDIVFAGSVLLVISPILLLVIIAIRLESKGPIVYKSKRVGTGYRVFDFLKFRSMYPDADRRLKELAHLNQYAEDVIVSEPNTLPIDAAVPENVPYLVMPDGSKMSEDEYRDWKSRQAGSAFFKIANDPRITKVGKFIRNTSIDELPQLINVLKGDMSIVGNRPLPLYEAESLTSDDWAERFMAPAGITGLWQVEKRGTSEMSDEERKQLDNTYAQKHSLWFDIKIILRTIPALIQKENV